MTTVAALRNARKRWRQKRRAAGLSWLCVALNHAACSGRVGRLSPPSVPRPVCLCPCHKEDAPW